MMSNTTRIVVDPAMRHKQALEDLFEARAHYDSCPEQERTAAMLLVHVAFLNEEEARKAWVRSLAAGAAASN